MVDTIATAQVEVTLNTDKLDKKLKNSAADLQKAYTQSMAKLSSIVNSSVQKLNQVLKKAFTVVSATAFASVYKFLKSNTAEAQAFAMKVARLNAAMAELGSKILKLSIGGKTISQWVDVLTSKIRSLSQSDLQRMFNIIKKIALVWAGINAFNFLARTISSLREISGLVGNIAARGAGGAAGSAGIGAGVGAGVGTAAGVSKIAGPMGAMASKMYAGVTALAAAFSRVGGISGELGALLGASVAKMAIGVSSLVLQVGIFAAKMLTLAALFASLVIIGKELYDVSTEFKTAISTLVESFAGVGRAIAVAIKMLKGMSFDEAVTEVANAVNAKKDARNGGGTEPSTMDNYTDLFGWMKNFQASLQTMNEAFAAFDYKSTQDEASILQVQYDLFGQKIAQASQALAGVREDIAAELINNPFIDIKNSPLGAMEEALKSIIDDTKGKQDTLKNRIFEMYDAELDYRTSQKKLFEKYQELSKTPTLPQKVSGSLVAAEELRNTFTSGTIDLQQQLIDIEEKRLENQKEAQQVLDDMAEADTERNTILNRSYDTQSELLREWQYLSAPSPVIY